MRIYSLSIILTLLTFTLASNIIILNRGCKEFSPSGQCTCCSSRFYKDEEGICQPVNPNCFDYDEKTGACTSCYSGFVVIEDACLPQALFPSQKTRDPYCNKFKNEKCVKCAYGYFFNEEGKCQQADPNCKQFKEENGECYECYGGFVLEEKKCRVEPPSKGGDHCNEFRNGQCSKCSFGYYFDARRKCKKIPDTCLDFDTNAEQCQACYDGYELDQKKECVKTYSRPVDPGCFKFQDGLCLKCSHGYYFDKSKKCRQIPPTCLDFDSDEQKCKRCFPGFDVNPLGQCVVGTGDSGCREFKNGKCVKCSDGFYFNQQKQCIEIPASCADFDINKKICKLCYPGFDLDYENRCVESVGEGGCAQYRYGKCVKCSLGYYQKDDKCIQIPPTCSYFDTKKQKCQQCYPGYDLDQNNDCVKGIYEPIDLGCRQFKDGKCKKCSFGFYFDKNRQCKLIPASCSDYDTDAQKCNACYSGYDLDQKGECVESKQGDGDIGCAKWRDHQCEKCSIGFYFGGNRKCKLVPPTCRQFDSEKEVCEACYPGYGVNLLGECIENAPEQVDLGCNQFRNGVCSKCSKGFYFNSERKCKIIPPTCKKFNSDLQKCQQCYSGYEVSMGGKCQKKEEGEIDPYCREFKNGKCVACSFGAYFDENRVCVLSDISCKKFDKDTKQCQDCYVGYEVKGGKCIKSKQEDIDMFCNSFRDGACVSCSFRYFKGQSGKCQEVSPSCKDYNKENGDCTSCFNGFKVEGKKCVRDDKELEDANCAKWKYGKCEKCSQGSYFNDKVGKCQVISPLCKTSDSRSGRCKTCYPAFSLEDGKCVEDLYFQNQDPYCAQFKGETCERCSKGYFFDQENKCKASDVYCQTINLQNGKCKSCYSGYDLRGGKCVQDPDTLNDYNCARFEEGVCRKCSAGFFFDPAKKCKASNPLCKKFNPDGGACTQCYVGFRLKGTDCEIDDEFGEGASLCAEWREGTCLNCASRAYFDEEGFCKPVSQDCKTFNKADGSCRNCYSGFKLEGPRCIEAPEGERIGCAQYDEDNGKCKKCVNKSYLDHGKCIQIDDLCAQFDYKKKKCVGCYSGYSILNGKCEITKVEEGKEIENCFAYTPQGACLQCFDRFYLSHQQCKEVSVFCKKYDKKNGQCTDCYTGFDLKKGFCKRE